MSCWILCRMQRDSYWNVHFFTHIFNSLLFWIVLVPRSFGDSKQNGINLMEMLLFGHGFHYFYVHYRLNRSWKKKGVSFLSWEEKRETQKQCGGRREILSCIFLSAGEGYPLSVIDFVQGKLLESTPNYIIRWLFFILFVPVLFVRMVLSLLESGPIAKGADAPKIVLLLFCCCCCFLMQMNLK